MRHFQIFDHIDPFAATVGLAKQRLQIGEDGILTLVEGGRETAAYEGWKSLQSLITKARKLIKSGEDLADAAIERVNPGVTTEWQRMASPLHMFRIPLVTNPGCVEHVGAEIVHMPVGSLWWQNTEALFCTSNFGASPRYHLVFWLPKPGATNDGDD